MALILFVDDDPLTLETMSRAVQLLGHQALIASTGTEAMRIVEQQRLDLIFVDIRLPDMDGFDLIQRFTHENSTSGVPTLVLSADPDVLSAEKALSAGAREYVSKPVRLQELETLITNYAP